MSNPHDSTTALLAGLTGSNDEPVWGELDARFRPILVGFACRLGLDEADASDVAQETLVRFVADWRAGKFDRSRGRVRSWILGIARYRVADLKRARQRERIQRGDSAFAELHDDQALSAIWDVEHRRVMFDLAMRRLRETTHMAPKTLRAFELLMLEHRKPADVAAELGMTANDVYVAKHRGLDRLRQIVAQLERADEAGAQE